jgi:uncharacterized OB-fold protein
MKEVKLPKDGKVFSLAVNQTGSAEDFLIPYTNGYIELTNGIRIFGLIEDDGPEMKAEMETKVSLSEIRKNERGQLLYVFRPSAPKEAKKA